MTSVMALSNLSAMDKESPINSVQAETIIAALMSLRAGVLDEVNIRITKLVESDDELLTGIVCQFTATLDYLLGPQRFSLYIGYYDKTHQINPQTIGLAILDGSTLEPQPLGNLGYITDKLREYKVW